MGDPVALLEQGAQPLLVDGVEHGGAGRVHGVEGVLAGGVGRLGAEVRRPAEGPVGLVHDVPHLLDAVGQAGQVLHRVAQRAGRHVAQLGVDLAHRLLQAGDRLLQPREGGGRGGLPGGDRLLLGPGAVDGDGEASPLVAGLLGVRELGGQGVDLGGGVRGRTALGGGRAVRPAVLGVGERPGREVDALGQPGDLGVGGVLVGLGDRVDGGQGGCGVLRAAAHLARVARRRGRRPARRPSRPAAG